MKNEIRRVMDTNLAGLQMTEAHVQHLLRQIRQERKAPRKLPAGLIFACILVLLAAAALAMSVMSGVRFWNWDHLGSPLDMVAIGNQVFFYTEDALYQWNPSEEKAEKLFDHNRPAQTEIQPVFSSLFVQDEDLMLLGEPGKLWRFKQGKWNLERDYSGTPLAAYADQYKSLFQQDNALFLLRTDRKTAVNGLYRLDLTDGSVRQLMLGEVMEICEYKNGTILAVVLDEDQQEKLMAIDTQSGEPVKTLATLHTLAVDGLTYDKAHDSIYAMVDGALCKWADSEWQIIRKTSIPGLSHSFCIADGKYLAANHKGIQSIPLEPVHDRQEKTLTIRGYRNTAYNLDHDYQQLHPELSLSRQLEAHLCAQEVQRAILAGDETDLFHLHVDANWLQLLKSGLLEPIHSAKLDAFMKNAEEPFRRLVCREGKVYAVLSDITITAWEKTAMMTPESYSELLQKGMQVTWAAQENWSVEDYVSHILRQQIAESGEKFDAEPFRTTMEALKKDLSSEERHPAVNASTVFDLSNLFPHRRYAAPLRVNADLPKRFPVRVHLYVLNPNSRNKEEAIAFLEYAVSAADAQQRALLSPFRAEPALQPFAEQWCEQIKQEHEMNHAQGNEVSERELERRLTEIRAIPGHWQVSQERLNLYRDHLFPKLDFRLHPLLAGHNQAFVQMEKEIHKYLNETIELNELIVRLEQLAR